MQLTPPPTFQSEQVLVHWCSLTHLVFHRFEIFSISKDIIIGVWAMGLMHSGGGGGGVNGCRIFMETCNEITRI